MHSTPFLNFQNVPIALGHGDDIASDPGHSAFARRNENGQRIGISSCKKLAHGSLYRRLRPR